MSESYSVTQYWGLVYAYQTIINTIHHPQVEENPSGSNPTPMTSTVDNANPVTDTASNPVPMNSGRKHQGRL